MNIYGGDDARRCIAGCRESGGTGGTAVASPVVNREGTMSYVIAPRRIVDFLVGVAEHAFFVIVGFVLMVVGLGLGVTMIMLPVGLAVGLLGFAMFVGGMTVQHIDRP